ncbi:MAG: sulfatase-like hydrolase/transferase [Deltaproteobacteria bacterium]|nr:sulfatase-like hydrolase/transferase [Deltaproteobacteria bacterium]
MNKKKMIKYGISAAGLMILLFFGYKAINIYTHPPVDDNSVSQVSSSAPLTGAGLKTPTLEEQKTVWNNQFAKKTFFALAGMFIFLITIVPPKKLWIPKVLFSLGLVVLILYHLLADGKIGALWSNGIEISVFWIIMAFIVKGSGMAATVWRWKVLLNGQGFRIPLRHLIESFLIGRFIGSFAPGTSGLDGYRAYDISRYTGKIARSLAVIFVEKLIGFFVLGTLLLIAVPLGQSLFASKSVNSSALIMMALAFLGMMAVSFTVLFKPGIIRWIADKFIPKKSPIRKKVDKAVNAVAAYEHRKLYLVKAVAIGFIVHIGTIGMYFCTSRAILSAPPSLDLFVTSALMIGATVLPLSIAGIGMREGVFVFFLGPVAAIYAFGGYLVGEIISLFGGPVWLARKTDYYEVLKAQRENINKDVDEDEADDENETEIASTENNSVESFAPASIVDYSITGLSAGLLGGLAVAVFDSIRLWIIGGVDWSLPGYAALLYMPLLGLMGAAAGFVLALFDRFVERKPSSRIGLGSFIGMSLFYVFAMAISYFYLYRDVFGEKLGLLSPKMGGSLLGMAAGIFLVLLAIGFILVKVFSKGENKFQKHSFSFGVTVLITLFLVIMWKVDARKQVGEPLQDAPKKDMPNVIIVMNDTHRADYTGVYGGQKDLTPNLDKFAEDAVAYQGFANASWTRPSVSTILTGRYPSSHTATLKGSILPDEITTLAEVMTGGGYETLGIASNYNLTPFFNVDQGFSSYKYLPPNLPLGSTDEQSKLIFIEIAKKISAKLKGKHESTEDYYVIGEKVTDEVLKKLDSRKKDRPFFMFTTYMDVHDPYFRHPYDGYAISSRANPDPDPNDTKLIEEMKTLYKGEIKYWDSQFGRLIDGLKKRDIYDNTLIMVLSDHGEEFGEHGGFWHGTTLYDEMLHILFITKYPESSVYADSKGVKVDSWHSLVDVAPMVIAEAGLEIPKEMQGVKEHTEEHDRVFSEEDHQGNVLSSVRFESKNGELIKAIEANKNNPRGLPQNEMFNLKDDPKEKTDIAKAETLTDEAKALMTQAKIKAVEGKAKAATGELSSDMKSQLKALGYMKEDK